jgi:hypothetical protein
MKSCKLLFAAAGATVLLGLLVSSASARNLSVSNQSIRSTWSAVSFSSVGFFEVRCHLTLEGSLHSRTFSKSIGSLIGYITSAILGPCENGTATILRETLPWHVRYSGFEGTLPEIRSIIVHVTGAAFRISSSLLTCLTLTSGAEPAIVRFHRNPTTHSITEVGIEGRIRTGMGCSGAVGTLSSTSGTVSLLGSITAIEVSLI